MQPSNFANMHSEWIIISVGGSLIVPDTVDTSFLRNFKETVERQLARGKRFIIVAGGGKTARIYQHAARKVIKLSRDDLDWLGIHSTRLNAHLLRTIFKEHAHPQVLKDFTDAKKVTTNLAIAAGWKPGHSTDFDAVSIAEVLGATNVINMSNTDYVYDRDPKKYPDAQKYEKLTWEEFRNIIPKEWSPGLSSPFDPIASQKADELNLEVAILNGKRLDAFTNYIDEKDFIGTVIQN